MIGTMIPIDETRQNIRPIFLLPVVSNSKRSNKATTYLTLPLELRQQILFNAIDDNIIQFKERYRANLVGEYDWYALQYTLLEAKKVCLQMESVVRAISPRVEEDFEGVLKKFEREVKWMAEAIMNIEEEMGFVAGSRWFAHYAEWRRWM